MTRHAVILALVGLMCVAQLALGKRMSHMHAELKPSSSGVEIQVSAPSGIEASAELVSSFSGSGSGDVIEKTITLGSSGTHVIDLSSGGSAADGGGDGEADAGSSTGAPDPVQEAEKLVNGEGKTKLSSGKFHGARGLLKNQPLAALGAGYGRKDADDLNETVEEEEEEEAAEEAPLPLNDHPINTDDDPMTDLEQTQDREENTPVVAVGKPHTSEMVGDPKRAGYAAVKGTQTVAKIAKPSSCGCYSCPCPQTVCGCNTCPCPAAAQQGQPQQAQPQQQPTPQQQHNNHALTSLEQRQLAETPNLDPKYGTDIHHPDPERNRLHHNLRDTYKNFAALSQDLNNLREHFFHLRKVHYQIIRQIHYKQERVNLRPKTPAELRKIAAKEAEKEKATAQALKLKKEEEAEKKLEKEEADRIVELKKQEETMTQINHLMKEIDSEKIQLPALFAAQVPSPSDFLQRIKKFPTLNNYFKLMGHGDEESKLQLIPLRAKAMGELKQMQDEWKEEAEATNKAGKSAQKDSMKQDKDNKDDAEKAAQAAVANQQS